VIPGRVSNLQPVAFNRLTLAEDDLLFLSMYTVRGSLLGLVFSAHLLLLVDRTIT
jgi:hypothetical protein